ncbi:MAG TPA: hypothetical protein VFA10_30220 [Ktedonobacteraceae bacterium]|nr:hypothetical protein [Ktedonobacteraceae bacterium]
MKNPLGESIFWGILFLFSVACLMISFALFLLPVPFPWHGLTIASVLLSLLTCGVIGQGIYRFLEDWRNTSTDEHYSS